MATRSILVEATIPVDHARAQAVFAAAANVTRLRVLCELCDGELSVTELCERIEIASATLSQHLSVLRHARLVLQRREGIYVFYRLAPVVTERLMLFVYRNFDM
ncbi:ArsR/SmtB family transcription factor [Rhizobium wenxiniae]|uniref:ArsR/SmtB family transcription factor n=1 Tax=Rhizobium wenxiniae TaxID=1737357 RepID=UPI003C2CCC97